MADRNKQQQIYKIFISFLLCVQYVHATNMLYKRNPDAIYERDLVAVSSTVIPLSVLEVSYGLGGKPTEEYKEAYLKRLRQKLQHSSRGIASDFQNPDTLITIKNNKKYYETINADEEEEAKIKHTA